MPTHTGNKNHVSGVFEAVCHPMERVILEGQEFPRCGRCNQETDWTFLRKYPPSRLRAGETRSGEPKVAQDGS